MSPFDKTTLNGGMSFPSRDLILLAINLARILYEALHNEIGLNLLKELRFTSLGIKAKKVELILPPNLDFCWKDLIILSKSTFIVSQHVL